MSVTTIDLAALRRVIAAGAQLVEVLPAEEYEELHLPGVINIPLKRLDANPRSSWTGAASPPAGALRRRHLGVDAPGRHARRSRPTRGRPQLEQRD